MRPRPGARACGAALPAAVSAVAGRGGTALGGDVCMCHLTHTPHVTPLRMHPIQSARGREAKQRFLLYDVDSTMKKEENWTTVQNCNLQQN